MNIYILKIFDAFKLILKTYLLTYLLKTVYLSKKLIIVTVTYTWMGKMIHVTRSISNCPKTRGNPYELKKER